MNFIIQRSEMPFDQHACPLVVIRCIDFRFRDADQRYVTESLGVANFDMIGLPAPAKQFLQDSSTREYLANVIETVCIGKHRVSSVLILGHWDCGGYGGSKAFASAEAEEIQYIADLRSARSYLIERFQTHKISIAYSRMDSDKLTYHRIDEK